MGDWLAVYTHMICCNKTFAELLLDATGLFCGLHAKCYAVPQSEPVGEPVGEPIGHFPDYCVSQFISVQQLKLAYRWLTEARSRRQSLTPCRARLQHDV